MTENDPPYETDPNQAELDLQLPQLSRKDRMRELHLAVFETPEGRELLDVWMAAAGLLSWTGFDTANGVPLDEQRIRKDERQRFLFTILDHMTLTPENQRKRIVERFQARLDKQQPEY